MEPRIFHGNLTPDDIARALTARFNRTNLRTQQFGNGEAITVQIGTRQAARAGGNTALTVNVQKVDDGVAVQVDRQAWLGVAASLGATAFSAMRNPLSLLGRLDDIAQDIENLRLVDEVWQTVEALARTAGASFELSARLRRMVCEHCRTANPVGEASCVACGAPLGKVQPRTCLNCGFVVTSQEAFCPNCKKPL
jgi:RNA polymerase subunit RPABC4/transcription elongation factor Spt4